MKNDKHLNSFGAFAELKTKNGTVKYYRIDVLNEKGIADVSRLPFSIKILLESVLRSENGHDVTKEDVLKLANYNYNSPQSVKIPFKPARVLLQDFTGVPCVVDLAAMRSAVARFNYDPKYINPCIPVDLVIDHSIQVDSYNSPFASEENAAFDFKRNRERYEFLHWGQKAFKNFRVIPPGRGICHQINLEYLAKVVQVNKIAGDLVAFPDSLVGTDSHTTMINGLGIAGWGVGGIEAESVMLGQPLYILAPEVIGFKLTGVLPEGSNATDLVLTITEILRRKGVVGKFVEFYGSGLSNITVSERATVANMAPEYGATMGYFPVDEQTLSYLKSTGRPEELVELVEFYCRAQGIFRDEDTPEPVFSEKIELDISTVKTSLSGPNRPQDRIELKNMKNRWNKLLGLPAEKCGFNLGGIELQKRTQVKLPDGSTAEMTHGSVVIAAVTSCTNTSNPSVMLGAGLLAKKALEAGLSSKPWVKTTFAPGSVVVTKYLEDTGLMPFLEKLGFSLVGYGCTTCIGNSGPLPENIETAAKDDNLVFAGILSGNRNFEGRINPHVRACFLASPPLVIAYSIAGTVNIDLSSEPLGYSSDGKPVFLSDIWPSNKEISAYMEKAFIPDNFINKYSNIEHSNEEWNRISSTDEVVYNWKEESTYIQEPDFFLDMPEKPPHIEPIINARVIVMLGDSITTDHISPAGAITEETPAGRYLMEKSVQPPDFNSYGSRRGNHNVMTRGTFANIRLRNILAPGTEGGWTKFMPTGEIISIYDASMKYKESRVSTVVIAGRDYGMGSSRDWAAKGTYLLGIKAVIAESFERIHRSNLVGMGVIPLQFKEGQNPQTLKLNGSETYSIYLDDKLEPEQDIKVDIIDDTGNKKSITVTCRLDSHIELKYYKNKGILQTVLRNIFNEQRG